MRRPGRGSGTLDLAQAVAAAKRIEEIAEDQLRNMPAALQMAGLGPAVQAIVMDAISIKAARMARELRMKL